jgi:hypothetical protein
LLLRPSTIRLTARRCDARLPFRFGIATMTQAPMLVAELEVETEAGMVVGRAGELLVPKWFSKDPSTSVEDDRRDLIDAARLAFDEVRTFGSVGGGATAFDLWAHAQMACVERPDVAAADRLVRTFGVSLIERALIDATCTALSSSFFDTLAGDALGIHMEAFDERLGGWSAASLGRRSESVRVRHTVGLVDALTDEEVPEEDRREDDHPVCLTEDIATFGLDCFKLKVSGSVEADLARLETIASITPDGAHFTLDGNEQYEDPARLAAMLDELDERGNAPGLLSGLLAIEQPVHRANTFAPETAAGVARLAERAPVIIDEADADLSAYPRARALGYGGVSMKACKGVFRALLARARIDADGEGVQSAEDLTNLPILPLHQDLAMVSALGLPHVERNGHHYFLGQAHLSEEERERLQAAHGSLYSPAGKLRIEDGRLDLSSLAVPGFGYAGPITMSVGEPVAETPA